jgi:hypothetical protein
MPDALMEGKSTKPDEEPPEDYLEKSSELEAAIAAGEEFDSEGSDNELKDEFEFPQLPDRWLVVRTWPSASSSTPKAKAWVVESDTLSVSTLNAWHSLGAAAESDEMTAVGPANGDPTWTVTYDNAERRFTFHDDVESGVSGPLDYLVTGWYSDKTRDPLWSTSSMEKVAWYEMIKELGWFVDSQSIEAAVNNADSSNLLNFDLIKLSDWGVK